MQTSWTLALTVVALLLVGFPVRALLRRAGLPPAVSLMSLGLVAGSSVLDVIPDAYLQQAGALARVAFVVLLLRAGLSLPWASVSRIAPTAVVLGLVPALAELTLVTTTARTFLFDRWDLALLSGFLVAAVSPAVILPTMLEQKEKGLGALRAVPDRIMGLAIVNAVVAQTGILVLTEAVTSARAVGFRPLAWLPVALAGGVAFGVLTGFLIAFAVRRVRASEGSAVGGVTLLSLAAAVAVYFGATWLTLDGVFAALCVGIALRARSGALASGLRSHLHAVWSVAEILLFANLGAMIDLGSLEGPMLIGGFVALVVVGVLVRKTMSWLLLMRSDLARPERKYMTLAQIPKATLQAVFGPVVYLALSHESVGLAQEGQTLLVMAVVAILVTAPFGAVALDRWAARLLEADEA